MRKIFIFNRSMELCGVNRSLIAILYSIDYREYIVNLFVCCHKGEMMEMIPSSVNLLPEVKEYKLLADSVYKTLLSGAFSIAAAKIKAKFKSLLNEADSKENFLDASYLYDYAIPHLPIIDRETIYDLSISFLAPHTIACNKVKSKKTIAWIHTDYSSIQIDKQNEFKHWARFDHIVSISDQVSYNFLKIFPSLASKIVLIENITISKQILSFANEFDASSEISTYTNSVKFLSIGSLTYAKGFDKAVLICKKIVEAGICLKWYIIGSGEDKNKIEKIIKYEKMTNNFILLGLKKNPFPYLKLCDFYIQPSRYEGKSMAVREAQILGKPVIVTNFPTAKSNVLNDFNGVIVPEDVDSASAQIISLIKDKKRTKLIKENAKSLNYQNENEIQKLYNIF